MGVFLSYRNNDNNGISICNHDGDDTTDNTTKQGDNLVCLSSVTV